MVKSDKFGEGDVFVKECSETVMLSIMDIDGVLDILEVEVEGDKGFEIYTEFNQFAHVRDAINKLGYVLMEAVVIKEAKMKKKLEAKEVERLEEVIEKIEENDDVQDVWTDLE